MVCILLRINILYMLNESITGRSLPCLLEDLGKICQKWNLQPSRKRIQQDYTSSHTDKSLNLLREHFEKRIIYRYNDIVYTWFTWLFNIAELRLILFFQQLSTIEKEYVQWYINFRNEARLFWYIQIAQVNCLQSHFL